LMLDAYCTSDEIAAARPDIAVIGIGAVEQHSDHLPVGTDWIGVSGLSRLVAERLGAFLVPALPFSMSQCHGAAAGTVWLKPETLAEVLNDLVISLYNAGIRKVVVINGHGGNFVLEATIQDLNLSNPDLQVIMPSSSSPGVPQGPIFETAHLEVHAGESETSTQLYFNAEHVKDERVDYVPPVGREFLDYAVIRQISPHGVWGVPSKATAEKGEKATLRDAEAIAAQARAIFATLDSHKARVEGVE